MRVREDRRRARAKDPEALQAAPLPRYLAAKAFAVATSGEGDPPPLQGRQSPPLPVCPRCRQSPIARGRKACVTCLAKDRAVYWHRLQSGTCTRCGTRPPDLPRLQCLQCLAHQQAVYQKRQAMRRAQGLCLTCGTQPMFLTYTVCRKHYLLQRHTARTRQEGRRRRANL